jgi:hypothetical protein
MSVTRLPSGRWRAQVYDPATGKNISVSALLAGPWNFPDQGRSESGARAVRERALPSSGGDDGATVAAFAARWTSDPLFARPKE